jgi:hypothetical protein
MFNISMFLQCLNITMFYSRRNILVRSCVAEEIEALCGEFLLRVGNFHKIIKEKKCRICSSHFNPRMLGCVLVAVVQGKRMLDCGLTST